MDTQAQARGRVLGERRQRFVFEEGQGLSSAEQPYDVTTAVNEIRRYVAQWRYIPNPCGWGIAAETALLLQHWGHHKFSHYRPFFCQVEAVEALIWLTEVAPRLGRGEGWPYSAWKAPAWKRIQNCCG